MQFIFQHQPEQSKNSQSGSSERLQSAQGAVGRPLDDQQKQGQAFIDKARDLVDQQVDTYEQSLKLIQKTGLNKEQAQEVLYDPANPYITDFMDFVERMDKNGTKFVGFSESGTFIFNDQQGSYRGINYSSVPVERALKWGSVIYPNLKAISQGFRYSLVKKAIADKTPAMDKFIEDLALGNAIGAGEREAVREELRKLNSGETILTNKNDETEEEPDAWEEARSEAHEVGEIRAALPEQQTLNTLSKNIPFDTRMKEYDLNNFLHETTPLLDSLAQKNKALGTINEDVKRILADGKNLMFTAKNMSAEEIKTALVNIPGAGQLGEKLKNTIKNSTPEEKALASAYENVIETQYMAMWSTYVKSTKESVQ